jgi:hypothetical protein
MALRFMKVAREAVFMRTNVKKSACRRLLFESSVLPAMLVCAVKFPMLKRLMPPLLLPMDSRLMPRTGAKGNVAQPHRFPEFLQSPRQPLGVRGCFAPMGVPLSAATSNVSAKTNTKSFR